MERACSSRYDAVAKYSFVLRRKPFTACSSFFPSLFLVAFYSIFLELFFFSIRFFSHSFVCSLAQSTVSFPSSLYSSIFIIIAFFVIIKQSVPVFVFSQLTTTTQNNRQKRQLMVCVRSGPLTFVLDHYLSDLSML